MRLHALHLQGLRRPQGVTRLNLETGYTLLAVSEAEDGQAVRAALEALLYPASRLSVVQPWVTDASELPPRVGLSFTLGSESLRTIADLGSGRVHLGRFDAEAGRYERVSTEPAEIETYLAEHGLPSPERLLQERALGWDAPVEPPALATRPEVEAASGEREQLEAELARSEAQHRTLEELEARASRLRAAREHFVDLERRTKRHPELERLSALGDRIEGLESRVSRFRELCLTRDSERESIAASRKALLEERGRLRGVPSRQRPWSWLGIALGVTGVAAAELVDVWLGAFALAGVGIALTAMGVAASARRRLGSAETSLAALRVRERSLEREFESKGAEVRSLLVALDLDGQREFESKGAEVRSLLVALDLDGPDALIEEARRYRELQASAGDSRREIEEARREFPEEAELELGELEERIAALRAGAAPAELRARLAELEAREGEAHEPEAADGAESGARPDSGLDLDAVAVQSGLGRQQILEVLEPLVAPYLRTLSGGILREGRWEPGVGWRLEDENGVELGLEGLPAVVAVALRCALVEALAPHDPTPLLVGPTWGALDGAARDAVARALRRLGSVVQVLHVDTAEQPWSERADHVLRVGS
jgi:hypothetical protein